MNLYFIFFLSFRFLTANIAIEFIPLDLSISLKQVVSTAARIARDGTICVHGKKKNVFIRIYLSQYGVQSV